MDGYLDTEFVQPGFLRLDDPRCMQQRTVKVFGTSCIGPLMVVPVGPQYFCWKWKGGGGICSRFVDKINFPSH